MKIADIEFPDKCPADCPGKKDIRDLMGGLCFRCPIFNCTPIEGDMFSLLRPEDYRPDWAQEWRKWFDEGMKGLPKLYL